MKLRSEMTERELKVATLNQRMQRWFDETVFLAVRANELEDEGSLPGRTAELLLHSMREQLDRAEAYSIDKAAKRTEIAEVAV